MLRAIHRVVASDDVIEGGVGEGDVIEGGVGGGDVSLTISGTSESGNIPYNNPSADIDEVTHPGVNNQDLVILTEDFLLALAQMTPSLSTEDLIHYEAVHRRFSAT